MRANKKIMNLKRYSLLPTMRFEKANNQINPHGARRQCAPKSAPETICPESTYPGDNLPSRQFDPDIPQDNMPQRIHAPGDKVPRETMCPRDNMPWETMHPEDIISLRTTSLGRQCVICPFLYSSV